MIDIVVADDHPVVRHGIKQILVEESDIRLVAEASNAQELLEKIDALDCDVVLLDSYLLNVQQNDFNKFTAPTCLRKKSEIRISKEAPRTETNANS